MDNTIQNAEKAIYIEDSQNLNIYENINLLSRATSLQTVQKTNDLVQGLTLTGNTFIQKNPDYSYFETRYDKADTDGIQATINGNTFYPLYKPNNNSYYRSIAYGGVTNDI